MPVRQMRLVVTAEDYDQALELYRDVLGLPELGARLSLERAPSISTRAERIQFV